MRVSPMVAEMVTLGAGSSARIEVGNAGSAPLAFETKITRIAMGPNGELDETAADEDFLVFPPQGIVPVGSRQVVRLQWVGDPKVEASQAYFLWVRQLPVQTDVTKPAPSETGGSVAVEVLYTMKALIVVAPPNAQPVVKVDSVRPTLVRPPAPQIDASLSGGAAPALPPEEHGVEIVISNSGKRYALLSGANWLLAGTDTTGKPFTLNLNSDAVGKTVGIGFLAPSGGRRTFQVPTGIALDPAKPVTLSFSR
jgi:fimbrial chaperone protein